MRIRLLLYIGVTMFVVLCFTGIVISVDFDDVSYGVYVDTSIVQPDIVIFGNISFGVHVNTSILAGGWTTNSSYWEFYKLTYHRCDVQADGDVDIFDCTTTYGHIGDNDLYLYDVNSNYPLGDGDVDIFDCTTIYSHVGD